jgi:glycosyltransferase involved in cell wall biosynthesis
MKIAITSLYLPSGSKIGVGYQVHYLANELVRRGHAVMVFSQTGRSDDSLYEVVVVPSGRRFRTFGFAWALRDVDFSKFDVLNAHGDDWFLWGLNRPRHVHTYHGSCLAEALHSTTMVNRFRMGALALCEYNSLALVDARIAVSENTRRYIPFIDSVIPCGVNLDSFRPAPETQKSAAPSVLFVGTLRGRKRGAMLLDLFQRYVRAAFPGAEFWAVCEEKAEGPGVRWFGRAPVEELADLYRRAWVFCLPSSYEGFGVPYIEAMASGTPVVATPNVGAREVTRQGQCGVLATDGQLADALKQLLGDAEARRTLRARGLERAQDFSWGRVCGAYEAVYRGQTEAPVVKPVALDASAG